MQILMRDVRYGDVATTDWRQHSGPYVSVLRDSCEIAKPLPGVHATDAKSIFDSLSKHCAGRKEDRRTAIDLAIARDSFERRGSCIKWVPHLLNPADAMTHSNLSSGCDAIAHLLRTGMLTLSDADEERAALLGSPEKGRRSHAACRRHLREREQAMGARRPGESTRAQGGSG